MEKKVCNFCGMSYDEFLESGFLGCDHCYNEFKDELKPLIIKIHGSNKHIGRKPIKYQVNSEI